jgi:hypothetical protein
LLGLPYWVMPSVPVPPDAMGVPKSNVSAWPGVAPRKSAVPPAESVFVWSAPSVLKVSVPVAISSGTPGVPPVTSPPSTSAW